MQMYSNTAKEGSPRGSRLGMSLPHGMMRFRPQLFWQEVLPEHMVSSSLQFHCDLGSGRNFARQPGGGEVASDGGYARSVACAVPDGEVTADEARLVGRALREAAQLAGEDATPLRHLLSSCYCSTAAITEALCEASRQDHAEGVRLLLAARAEPLAQPAGKTALHAACEAGHEAVARLLVQAEPAAVGASGEALGGRTPPQVARDADLAGLARRVEAYAKEYSG